MPPVTIDDVAGGIHEGLHPAKISDREWRSLHNMYSYGREIYRRPALNAVTSSPFAGGELTGMFAYKKAAGMWTMLLGHRTGLAKLDGTGIVSLPIADGLSYTDTLAPWNAFQYSGITYWAREDTGTFKRAKEDFVQDAGIEAPAGAPTLADGGAGTLSAADYYGVYTFYNLETGVESNPSPVSVKLTLGANKQIAWSGIGISTNGQVTARRLYRVLPGQTGEYFFVATIADNFTTTYATDDSTPDEMGDSVSFRNGTPPDNVSIICNHEERNFCSNNVDVFYSAIGLMECFDPDAIIKVFPDDGHQIRALFSWGAKLFVGKTNKCVLISGDPGSFAREILSDEHGCYSHHSVQAVENLLIWYGGDDFYSSSGTAPLPIGDSKIKDTLSSIPDAYKDRVIAFVVPTKGGEPTRTSHLYCALIPGADGTYTHVLVYNYRTQSWQTWDYDGYGSGAPRFAGYFYDENYDTLVYSTFEDGHIHDMFSGMNTDNGTPIVCTGLGKAWGWQEDGSQSAVRNVQLMSPSISADLTVKLYRDLSATAYKSRTVSLNQREMWKRIGLSNIDAPSACVQFGFEYSGVPEFSISGMTYEINLYPGRMRSPI